MATVVLAGTLDTKGGEYVFIRDKILSLNFGCKVLLKGETTETSRLKSYEIHLNQ